MTDKKKAAIFDIDGTIFRGSLMETHYKLLVKYGFVPETIDVNEVRPLEQAWINREISYDDYLKKLVDVYVDILKDVSVADAEFVAKEVIRKHGKELYVHTREKIKEHKANGYSIILISGSPDFLVRRMAEYLDADLWFGTSYLFREKEGRYNGEIIPMWDSVSKNSTMDRLENFHNVDMENSYAYGDTNGDFLMLSKVGHPIAINPNRELLERIAASDFADRTQVIVERKDMIFSLSVDQAINPTIV